MVRVKVCGITQKQDALKAARLGAYAVGFIFYKKSSRYISPFKVQKIIKELPPFVQTVGVFVNEPIGKVRDVIKVCNLNVIQLHGDESPDYAHRLRRYGTKIIKAFRVQDGFDFNSVFQYKVDGYLFDTYSKYEYGGTGETFDYQPLKKLKSQTVPIILSGGLNKENVIQAVNDLNPFAVDVNSGIETKPGVKDLRLMQDFMEIVQYVSHPANRGK